MIATAAPQHPEPRTMTLQLRPYQREVARAVLRSVRQGLGMTFSVEIARQGGKNELSAQLETLLLTLFAAQGGTGLKTAPTWRPQIVTSLQRLKDRLTEARMPWTPEYGYQVRVGRARWLFLSGSESSNVLGATASILMEADEAQDLPLSKWEKDFRPMGAATNVTTVLYGTPWAGDDLLQTTKQRNLELEQADGTRRHFRYDWQQVAQHNPAYQAYVEAERDRLGPSHPLFLTQYALEYLEDHRRMFTQAQLTLMRGPFPKEAAPAAQGRYVAGLDVAGAAEAIEEPATEARSHRDSTVLTIGALRDGELHAVAAYAWRDVAHHTTTPEILRLAAHWRIEHLVVDATGQGEAMAGYLAKALGRRVTPYVFTRPSKSALAYDLIAWANRGALQLASGLDQELHQQLALARTKVYPNRAIDFYVDPREGHDDYLMSLALTVQAAQSLQPPRIARGRIEPLSHDGGATHDSLSLDGRGLGRG